ncbi:MAG: hypothetical protein N4A36_02575 [Candidatus Gracilibacteria bacterium]|jgi:hypothetical protein|nr:hypothetical protein [Candidatus Gracilibacteria bacterium]
MISQRVIYIEKHDELDKIISDLKRAKSDKVVLIIPRGAVFFESIINAKILRTKAEENAKEIYIITKDKKAKQMLYQAGITTFDTLDEFEMNPDKSPTPPVEEKGIIKHKKIEIKEDEPVDDVEKINWQEIFIRPSKIMLFSFVSISLALFFFVSTLILPGATIYIKPERKTIDTVINVVLTPEEKLQQTSILRRKQMISGAEIEAEFEKTIEFKTLSRNFKGSYAEGEIVLVNILEEERTLKPKTRFQSEDGVVYRISDWVKIPAAKNGQNGERKIKVKADETDIYGNITGDRGNKPVGTKLFLPGLSEAGRKYLWAEIREDMTGGTTIYDPVIKQSDINAARKQLEDKLIEETQKDLENYIKDQNALNGTNLQMVPHSKFLKKDIVEIKVQDDVLSKEIDSFKVYGKLKAKSWAFSESDLVSILQDNLAKSVDADMFLMSLDPDSITINVFSEDQIKEELKVNVHAKGIEAFLIEPETESGIRFVNKVKEQVVGKDAEESENILINFKEISDVKISLWPFFSRKIPKLPENISIKLWGED